MLYTPAFHNTLSISSLQNRPVYNMTVISHIVHASRHKFRKDLEKLLKVLGVLFFISTFVVRIVSDVENPFRHKNQTHYETKTYSKGRRNHGNLLGAW